MKCPDSQCTPNAFIVQGQGIPWWPQCFNENATGLSRPWQLVLNNVQNFSLANLTLLNPPNVFINCNNCVAGEIGPGLNLTAEWLCYDPDDPTGRCGCAENFYPHLSGGACSPPNTDGIDPGSGSHDLWIHDVFIWNGDDGIAIKPGFNEGTKGNAACTHDILVEDCELHRGFGIPIGGVSVGCVENITFRNIRLLDSPGCGAWVKLQNGTDPDAHVSNITYENLYMEDIRDKDYGCLSISALYFDQTYMGPYTPRVTDVTFRNITGVNCSAAGTFLCRAWAPCTGIRLEDVALKDSRAPFRCEHAAPDVAGFAHGTWEDVEPTPCLLPPTD